MMWIPAALMIYAGYSMYNYIDTSKGYLLISLRKITYYVDDKPSKEIIFNPSVKADVYTNSIFTTAEHGPLSGFDFQQGSLYIEFSGQTGYSVQDIRRINQSIHSFGCAI